ncbi:hypothetical protein ACWEKT_29435 [Nocardia takedensis]
MAVQEALFVEESVVGSVFGDDGDPGDRVVAVGWAWPSGWVVVDSCFVEEQVDGVF